MFGSIHFSRSTLTRPSKIRYLPSLLFGPYFLPITEASTGRPYLVSLSCLVGGYHLLAVGRGQMTNLGPMDCGWKLHMSFFWLEHLITSTRLSRAFFPCCNELWALVIWFAITPRSRFSYWLPLTCSMSNKLLLSLCCVESLVLQDSPRRGVRYLSVNYLLFKKVKVGVGLLHCKSFHMSFHS